MCINSNCSCGCYTKEEHEELNEEIKQEGNE